MIVVRWCQESSAGVKSRQLVLYRRARVEEEDMKRLVPSPGRLRRVADGPRAEKGAVEGVLADGLLDLDGAVADDEPRPAKRCPPS